MQLHGLHHVTAGTGNAPGNLEFYTRVLGLRLVKKTVNQDDTSAYHPVSYTHLDVYKRQTSMPTRPSATP